MPFGIDAGDRPAGLGRPGKGARIDVDRIAMVAVHVVDGRLFGFGELAVCRAVDDEIGARQQIGLAEAAVQAGALDLEAEEGEIAEAGIELGLGIAVEIAALGAVCSACRVPAARPGRLSVMRGCASGSPLPGSPSSSEQRGSASDRRRCAPTATRRGSAARRRDRSRRATRLASGAPVAGRAPRARRNAPSGSASLRAGSPRRRSRGSTFFLLPCDHAYPDHAIIRRSRPSRKPLRLARDPEAREDRGRVERVALGRPECRRRCGKAAAPAPGARSARVDMGVARTLMGMRGASVATAPARRRHRTAAKSRPILARLLAHPAAMAAAHLVPQLRSYCPRPKLVERQQSRELGEELRLQAGHRDWPPSAVS